MNKSLFTCAVLMLTLGLGSSAIAQESGFPVEEGERQQDPQYPSEEIYNVREGGMMPEERSTVTPEKKTDSPAVSTPAKQPVVRTRPVVTQPDSSKPGKSPEVEGEKDDSILSFNFLYYLIQKFKFETVE